MSEINSQAHVTFCVFSGGIPPPIYFGALIDQTCLKWGSKQCGGRGACRIYDADAFRYTATKLLLLEYSALRKMLVNHFF